MCMRLIYFASSFLEACHQMQIYQLIFVLEKEKKILSALHYYVGGFHSLQPSYVYSESLG